MLTLSFYGKDLAELPKEEWPTGAENLREPDPKALKTFHPFLHHCMMIPH